MKSETVRERAKEGENVTRGHFPLIRLTQINDQTALSHQNFFYGLMKC